MSVAIFDDEGHYGAVIVFGTNLTLGETTSPRQLSNDLQPLIDIFVVNAIEAEMLARSHRIVSALARNCLAQTQS